MLLFNEHFPSWAPLADCSWKVCKETAEDCMSDTFLETRFPCWRPINRYQMVIFNNASDSQAIELVGNRLSGKQAIGLID